MTTTRPTKPDGIPWMMPYLVVSSAERSLEFYEKAFGFTRTVEMPGPDGKIMHAEMSYKDCRFMFASQGNQGCKVVPPKANGADGPVNFYFYTDDVERAYQRALGAGAESVTAPQDMFWGDRIATVRDPDGYLWSMAKNVGEFDASKMVA